MTAICGYGDDRLHDRLSAMSNDRHVARHPVPIDALLAASRIRKCFVIAELSTGAGSGTPNALPTNGRPLFDNSKPAVRRGRKATGQARPLTPDSRVAEGGSTAPVAREPSAAALTCRRRRRAVHTARDVRLGCSGNPRCVLDGAHHECRWKRADRSGLVQPLLRDHELAVSRLDVRVCDLADSSPWPGSDAERYAHRAHDEHAVLRGRLGGGQRR